MDRSIRSIVAFIFIALALAACGDETRSVDTDKVPFKLRISVLGIKPTSAVIVFEVNKPGAEIMVSFGRLRPSPVLFKLENRLTGTWAYDGLTPDTTDVLSALATSSDGETDENWVEITTPAAPEEPKEDALAVQDFAVTPLTSRVVDATFKVNKPVSVELYASEDGSYFFPADIVRDATGQEGESYRIRFYHNHNSATFSIFKVRLYVFTADGEVVRQIGFYSVLSPELKTSVNSVTSTELDVSWQTTITGGTYNNVYVECFQPGGENIWRSDERVHVDSGRVVLTGFTPYTNYTCNVGGSRASDNLPVRGAQFVIAFPP